MRFEDVHVFVDGERLHRYFAVQWGGSAVAAGAAVRCGEKYAREGRKVLVVGHPAPGTGDPVVLYESGEVKASR